MNSYQIQYADNKATIVDAAGVAIDEDLAATILEDLLQQYKLPCSVYIAYAPSAELYKIGISRNVPRRMSELRTILVHEIECRSIGAAWRREHALHSFYTRRGKHEEGEWFALEADDLTRICSISWMPLEIGDGFAIMTAYSDVIMKEIRAQGGEAAVARVREVIDEQRRLLIQCQAEIEAEILAEESQQ